MLDELVIVSAHRVSPCGGGKSNHRFSIDMFENHTFPIGFIVGAAIIALMIIGVYIQVMRRKRLRLKFKDRCASNWASERATNPA